MYRPGPVGLFWTKNAINEWCGRIASLVDFRVLRGTFSAERVPGGPLYHPVVSLQKMAIYLIGERRITTTPS